ncbi:hypothetical protein [Streptomyces sp. NPDC001381]|uniref:hypothetical protein n=1 Tax=Streptomyces sp. NPDC001381 TaxID=3364567 RepID=UPI0036BE0443
MSADEVRAGSSASPDRPGTGPRHAAPKKPLFTRLPAGKAIAMAAMPTAVLMGMGFTPTLAVADDAPTSNSKLADEYKDCVAALDGADASASASASPSPSASESTSGSTSGSSDDGSGSQDSQNSSGGSSSSDSGSDDTAEPSPSASSEAASSADKSSSPDDTATPSPSASETDKNVLETIGDAITDLFDGNGSGDATATASPSASATASPTTGTGGSGSADSGSSDSSSGKDDSAGGTVKDTTDAVTDTVKDTAGDATEAAGDAADDATAAADEATASPSPSASSTTDAENCLAATDDEGGVDNKILVADDPWYLQASGLLLKGADYQGIVEVKTASGSKKKVLKYVISGGTDIDDLHQTVKDKKSGKTYHVQAGKGTKSTITDGDTVMYTESISGNLFGLIPITFSPDNPPPLNIPLIYFSNVKVTQAGQFGGTLHVPGMQVYTTDS